MSNATPFAVRPNDFPSIYGISRSRAFELIAKGALPARKVGRTTLVLAEDVEKFLRSRPIGLDPAPEAAIAARKAKKVGA
ncbi:helix-turn-helix domain-containing protein [Xanthobacter autotrophicus]|uniref:helix-turn-helix domain-containing protein n=1 Tax=Xanthobacter autotrophicus TaxID=280 RepID=UPI0024A6DB2E|nr:helix-turn-helix domain-containing protein [Xanthobacter autotrophicus]MDI4655551.1 helix-turn-helix domain-containing protein [Xanthobacter autotrophicus]